MKTLYETCKYWESQGQKSVYEKTFEYSFRKLKKSLRLLKKIWYIECIISEKRKAIKLNKEWDNLPF